MKNLLLAIILFPTLSFAQTAIPTRIAVQQYLFVAEWPQKTETSSDAIKVCFFIENTTVEFCTQTPTIVTNNEMTVDVNGTPTPFSVNTTSDVATAVVILDEGVEYSIRAKAYSSEGIESASSPNVYIINLMKPNSPVLLD